MKDVLVRRMTGGSPIDEGGFSLSGDIFGGEACMSALKLRKDIVINTTYMDFLYVSFSQDCYVIILGQNNELINLRFMTLKKK